MQVGVISILLLSLLAGEGAEMSAVREYRHQRLDQATLLLQLLQHRKRSRRERRSTWQDEQIRVAYLGGRIAMHRRKYQEAVNWFAPLYKKHRKSSSIGDHIAYHTGRAYLYNRQPKKAATVFAWMIKNLKSRWRLKARRRLITSLRRAKQWKKLSVVLGKVKSYPAKYGGREYVWWKQMQAMAKAGDIKDAAKSMQRFLLYYPKSKYARRAKHQLKTWQARKLCTVKSLKRSDRRFQLSRMARLYPKKAIQEAPQWWSSLSKSYRSNRHHLTSHRLMMSLAYIKAERLKDAIPLLRKVLNDKRSPKYARRLAIRRLGKVFRDLGMYKEGEKTLYRYAVRHPEYYRTAAWASYNAAWMALYQHKYHRAHKLFGEYLRVYRRSARKRRWRVKWFQAWCKLQTGQYNSAIRSFKKLGKRARHYTDRRRCSYWVARAYERQGKWNKAREHMASLAKRSPLSYYGLLAQQRLYRMDVLLPQHRKGVSCIPKKKRAKKTKDWIPSTVAQSNKQKSVVRGLPWSKMVARSFATQKPTWQVTPSVQKFIKQASHEASQPAIFPKMPRRCRRSRSKACQSWRRARLLSDLGLDKDAAKELFRGRRAIRRTLPNILSMIRWFRSVGAYHEAVRMSYFLSGPQPRRGLSRETWMKILFPPAFSKQLVHFSKKAGISPAFAWSIMREESLYSPMARSHVGAKGLMQVINYTGRRIARQLKVKRFRPLQLYRPTKSIRFGTWYLGQLTRKFGGHMLLAAAGYNAGPHRIAVWLKNRQHLGFDEFVEELYFTETRVYVKRIFRTFAAYSFLYLRRLPSAPPTVAIKVGNNIDF